MGIKKLFLQISLLLFPVFSTHALSVGVVKQTIQINTHFHCVFAKPTWLLIVRELDTGRVLPYIFDIVNNDNFWVAFSTSHHYQITASTLKFGPYAVIHDFCHLEGCPVSDKSFFVRLRGDLTPNPNTMRCIVSKYRDYYSNLNLPPVIFN